MKQYTCDLGVRNFLKKHKGGLKERSTPLTPLYLISKEDKQTLILYITPDSVHSLLRKITFPLRLSPVEIWQNYASPY